MTKLLDQPVDNSPVQNNIVNQTGKMFTPPMIMGGWIFMVAGLLAFIPAPPVGVFLLLGGVFVVFAVVGTEINPSVRVFRQYSGFLGARWGKWQSLDRFPFLTILKSKKTYRMTSLAGISAIGTVDSSTKKNADIVYEVLLLTKTHRTRVVAAEFEGLEETKKKAVELSKATGCKLVNYSPERLPGSSRR